jgi:hypothetical protein
MQVHLKHSFFDKSLNHIRREQIDNQSFIFYYLYIKGFI